MNKKGKQKGQKEAKRAKKVFCLFCSFCFPSHSKVKQFIETYDSRTIYRKSRSENFWVMTSREGGPDY
jgi:hypothetical protein